MYVREICLAYGRTQGASLNMNKWRRCGSNSDRGHRSHLLRLSWATEFTRRTLPSGGKHVLEHLDLLLHRSLLAVRRCTTSQSSEYSPNFQRPPLGECAAWINWQPVARQGASRGQVPNRHCSSGGQASAHASRTVARRRGASKRIIAF